MNQSPTILPLSTAELRTQLQGSVITPEDPDYIEASTVKSGESGRPAVIIRAKSVADIVRTLALARQTGLELGGFAPEDTAPPLTARPRVGSSLTSAP